MLEDSQRFSTGELLPITFYIVTNLYTWLTTHHRDVALLRLYSLLNFLDTSIDRVATPYLLAHADTNFYFCNAIPWL